MQSRELVKLYYRIGEVSEIVGVQPHVLRYWETEFRSIRPQKSSKGQRVYSRRDVEKLLRVKDLLRNQGFTIAGARKRLSDASEVAVTHSPAAPVAFSSPAAGAPAAGAPAASISAASAPGAGAPVGGVPTAGTSAAGAEGGGASAPGAATVVKAQAAAAEQVVHRSAKDMRKALLGLRQDLMRMLEQLSALQARDRVSQ